MLKKSAGQFDPPPKGRSGRLPSVEDNIRWKTTFAVRQLSAEDLQWKMTFGGRRPSVEDDLCFKVFEVC